MKNTTFFLALEVKPGDYRPIDLTALPGYSGENSIELETIDSITKNLTADLLEKEIHQNNTIVTEEKGINNYVLLVPNPKNPRKQIKTAHLVCFQEYSEYLNPDNLIMFLKANQDNKRMFNLIDNSLNFEVDGCLADVKNSFNELSKTSTNRNELIERLNLIKYLDYNEFRYIAMFIATVVIPKYNDLIIPDFNQLEKEMVVQKYGEVMKALAINSEILDEFINKLVQLRKNNSGSKPNIMIDPRFYANLSLSQKQTEQK